ncbi:hypothetical protein ELH02_14235 [Rhizobium ruizarguesonis]|uniref:hypothetical protein n=1 Tax=Rhizobium ruizarguesonis TaxID=2081791 RepID=UPI0010304C6A|nr:hypothetical protein [Rhizobium ruizarguesonis]TBE45449.1 hypothetical protein ELH02_14235 [Rhizobium ruizarguesonis]
MLEDDRIWHVRDLVKEHVSSPSLRHIRDPAAILSISRRILKRIDRGAGIWQKWEGEREVLIKSAVGCWIPTDSLRDYLNLFPGPKLTSTDVAQRMKAIEEEPYTSYPNDDFREGCLAIFNEEKELGTELSAIIGRIANFVLEEEERLRVEREQRYKRARVEEQDAAEARLIAGADCKWTQLRGAPHFYCRTNGRTYRLSPTADKKWELFRVDRPSPDDNGEYIGRYGSRGNATKVVAEMAFQAEHRR